MTIHHDPADVSAPWRAAAAYLYTLDLDGPALAWEYLRRNAGYQAEWNGRRRVPALRWGLDVVEDPQLDARQTYPLWSAPADALLHVHAASMHHADTQPVFNLWGIPGRKRLVHVGTQLSFSAEHGPNRLHASLSAELEEGAAYGLTVPLDAHLRTRLTGYQVQANALQGQWPPVSTKKVTRASLLHLHALQALDASQAGARHRDIAAALFGADAVRTRWTADSELRAQVRHLLTRAEGLVRGGYLALAGVRQSPTGAPGDEPAR